MPSSPFRSVASAPHPNGLPPGLAACAASAVHNSISWMSFWGLLRLICMNARLTRKSTSATLSRFLRHPILQPVSCAEEEETLKHLFDSWEGDGIRCAQLGLQPVWRLQHTDMFGNAQCTQFHSTSIAHEQHH